MAVLPQSKLSLTGEQKQSAAGEAECGVSPLGPSLAARGRVEQPARDGGMLWGVSARCGPCLEVLRLRGFFPACASTLSWWEVQEWERGRLESARLSCKAPHLAPLEITLSVP